MIEAGRVRVCVHALAPLVGRCCGVVYYDYDPNAGQATSHHSHL